MSYYSRVYRHRNPNLQDENAKKPFFAKQNDTNKPGQRSAFFQAKLSVNQPGDKYEREADSVANAVVNHQTHSPDVQQKKISSIQRLSTSKEDEKLSTNDARMARDKEIQEKPIQKMSAGAEKEKKTSTVQTKQNESSNASPPSVSSKIENSSGKGDSLPKNTLHEMNSSFGVDFSNVKVHNGSDAVNMNKELQAQAFTHGRDIYFNEGKYHPESSGGKFLLAHELTHVVQQNSGENVNIQRFGTGDLCPDDNRQIITDSTVQGYINAALSGAKPSPGDSSNLKNAWLALTSQREEHCCDANLAAAEHYLYARYRVADGWEPYAMMVAMIVNYDTWGKYVMPKTGNCPITRPSGGLIKWGLNGATDGVADYYYPRP